MVLIVNLRVQVQPEHPDAEAAGGQHREAGGIVGRGAPEDRPSPGRAGQGAAVPAGDPPVQDAPDGGAKEGVQREPAAAGGEPPSQDGGNDAFWRSDATSLNVAAIFRRRRRSRKKS